MLHTFPKNYQTHPSLTLIAGLISAIGYCNSALSQTVSTTGSAVFNNPSTSPPSGQSSFNFGDLQLQQGGGTLDIDGGSATSTGWIKLSGTSSINVTNNGYFNAYQISLGYSYGTTLLNVESGSQVSINTLLASDYEGASIINVKGAGSLLKVSQLAMSRDPNLGTGTLNISQGGAVQTSSSLTLNNGNINISDAGSYLNANGGINSTTGRAIRVEITNGGKLNTSSAAFNQTSNNNSTNILIDGVNSSFNATNTVSLEGKEDFISLAVKNSAILKTNNLNIKRLNSTATPKAVVSIENSATLEAAQISNNGSDNSANLIYINGGTIRAANNNTNFISGIDSISLGASGIIIDTQSYDININTNFF